MLDMDTSQSLWKVPNRVKALRVVQKAVKADLALSGLGLRSAARAGALAPSTLSFLLDKERVTHPDKYPKRGIRRATLLALREVPWIGTRTTLVLGILLNRRAVSPVDRTTRLHTTPGDTTTM
jgi:hypothetical protein